MMQNEHFLITLSYAEYKPGMKLFLHQDHESLRKGSIVEIKEMNGFNKDTHSYKFPWGKGSLYFITSDGVKIIWNEVSISCYVERDVTTSFLEKMLDHYVSEADRMMADVNNYEWSKDNYERYLEDKHSTLIELLIEYEHQRVSVKKD